MYSISVLLTNINRYLQKHDDDLKPFVRTKPTDTARVRPEPAAVGVARSTARFPLKSG